MGDIYNDSKNDDIINKKLQIGIKENYKSRNTRYDELFNKYYENKNKEKDNKMNLYYDNTKNEILKRKKYILEDDEHDQDPQLIYQHNESDNSRKIKIFDKNIYDVINKYRNTVGSGQSRNHSKKKKNMNSQRYPYFDTKNISISNNRNKLLTPNNNSSYNFLEKSNKSITQIDDKKKIRTYNSISNLDNIIHKSFRNLSRTSQYPYDSKNHNEIIEFSNYNPTHHFNVKQIKNKIGNSNKTYCNDIINNLSKRGTNINDNFKYYKNGKSQYKDEIGRCDTHSHLSLYGNFDESNLKNDPDFFQKFPSKSLCIDNYKKMLKKGNLTKYNDNIKHTKLKRNDEIYTSSEIDQSDMDKEMKYEKPFYQLSNNITNGLETENMPYSQFYDKENERKTKIKNNCLYKNKLKSTISRKHSLNENYDHINRSYITKSFDNFENSSHYSDNVYDDNNNIYKIDKYEQNRFNINSNKNKDKIYKHLNCSDAITKYKSNTASLYNDKNTILNMSELENYDENKNKILINSYSGNPYFIDNKFEYTHQNDERKFKERKNNGKKNMIDAGNSNNIDAESVNSNNIKSTQLHISRISHYSNDFSTLYDYGNNSKYRHSNNNCEQSIGKHKINQYSNPDKMKNVFLENNKMPSNLHTTNYSDMHKSIHNCQYNNLSNYILNDNKDYHYNDDKYMHNNSNNNNWSGINTLLSTSHLSTKNKIKKKSQSRNNSKISRKYILTQNNEMENSKHYNNGINEEKRISMSSNNILSNKNNEILKKQGKYSLNNIQNNYNSEYIENINENKDYNELFYDINIFTKDKKKKNAKRNLSTKLKKDILLDSLLKHDDEYHDEMSCSEKEFHKKNINKRNVKLKKKCNTQNYRDIYNDYMIEENTNNPYTHQFSTFNNLKNRLFTRSMHIDDLNGDNYDANYDVNYGEKYGEKYNDSNFETNCYFDYTQICNSKNTSNCNECFYDKNNQNDNKKSTLSSLNYQEIIVLILIYILKFIYYLIYYIFHFFKQFTIYIFNQINKISLKCIIVSVIVSLPLLLFVFSSLLLSYRSLNIDYYDRDI
ncbi:conserved Plasmodium protein, unknown function [Plasmodium berghei]|uniref:CCAAT-box DNA binding protein subunit B n=2 Tax=Plasmodium berghei TaxID=5821 RepID=A0A509ALG4_PLABA|nr:conserved Plasmodium protein, unknown function [Plasmodium berghei ANKA]CXI54435.1 conserved Plasmodium protein, unknown function [Plasmodium berghei]SCL94977.1 conserved Plasmodium protein, unknown function [Plasmodium berghei]SCM16146.1 conserved Plasmodium protein, unknown function [Plasmodium berghei]SCM17942.1 conserved Plasmodium protein, unknown function [Plasmodium berghei]SCN26309.1 conserved Plasmodium protein, unknown function [Plasmodium berghei]|eukprot:XP_034422070.1 conserved Plasmodium protein, unknown function [Plasmodium berghei ANKA]